MINSLDQKCDDLGLNSLRIHWTPEKKSEKLMDDIPELFNEEMPMVTSLLKTEICPLHGTGASPVAGHSIHKIWVEAPVIPSNCFF